MLDAVVGILVWLFASLLFIFAEVINSRKYEERYKLRGQVNGAVAIGMMLPVFMLYMVFYVILYAGLIQWLIRGKDVGNPAMPYFRFYHFLFEPIHEPIVNFQQHIIEKHFPNRILYDIAEADEHDRKVANGDYVVDLGKMES